MNARELWSRILVVAGGIAMLVGAVDPMEGSLLILPGCGLVALAAYVAGDERRLLTYRVWAFVLIAIGVGALWGMSMAGGIGGSTGRSAWWSVLILPYLIGWSMSIWGPGAPRWMSWMGIGVGLWYQAILALALWKSSSYPDADVPVLPSVFLAAIGLLTIAGCVNRLRRTH